MSCPTDRLPLEQTPRDVAGPAYASSASSIRASDSGVRNVAIATTPARVLVIDDDEAMRRLAVGMLSARHLVFEAAGVTEGLEVLKREAIDLVLLDVMMPGISGFEGCKAIKAAVRGYVPVLLLTALGEQEDVVQGLEAGADDFLSKPVNRRELELRVATFVRLRRQEDLIARQLAELREMVGLKDDLVSVLVHDLRNPLAAVLSILRLLDQTIVDPESREDVKVGLAAAQQVAELAEDLMLVRLLESGSLNPTLELQSTVETVREAVATLRPMAAERKVRLTMIEREDASTSFDRKLVRRAVENLISNAIKYTRESVDVEVLSCAGGVDVTVADRGAGIPDVYKPALFEKYGSVEARAGNLRRGVGLGLYMVRLVAAAHHGDVAVEDRAGGGTIFRMHLGARA